MEYHAFEFCERKFSVLFFVLSFHGFLLNFMLASKYTGNNLRINVQSTGTPVSRETNHTWHKVSTKQLVHWSGGNVKVTAKHEKLEVFLNTTSLPRKVRI